MNILQLWSKYCLNIHETQINAVHQSYPSLGKLCVILARSIMYTSAGHVHQLRHDQHPSGIEATGIFGLEGTHMKMMLSSLESMCATFKTRVEGTLSWLTIMLKNVKNCVCSDGTPPKATPLFECWCSSGLVLHCSPDSFSYA